MAFARWLLALFVLVASCSSERARGPSSLEEESTRAVWTAVTELSALDTRLREVLAARASGEGWEWEEESTPPSRERMLTSPGYRGAQEKRWGELGSRSSERANGVWEVGLSQFSSNRVRLQSRDATPSRGELSEGRVLYRGGYGPGLDIVRTTTRTSVEEHVLLRDAASVASRMSGGTALRLSWEVELGSGMWGRELADGAVEFVDAVGAAVIHVPLPYGVDASGQRRAGRLGWDDVMRRLSVEFETAGLSFPVLLDPAFETMVWRKVQEPEPRIRASMAYDTKRRRVVLFGGMRGTSLLNDTWEWDGVTWSEVTPLGERPGAGGSPVMAYDAKRGRTVLFGGGQTWTWDGVTWTSMSTPIAPSPRVLQAMAYDAARERVVLFGGEVTTGADAGLKGDTWEWDGTTWTEVTPETSPSPRSNHSLAYDVKRSRVVLYGGEVASDTWEWDGTTWTQRSASSPMGPRRYLAMTYDVVRQGVVFAGGVSGASEVQADMWIWDGATWKAIETALPGKRSVHSLVYDIGRDRLVLFGGASTASALVSDLVAGTWTWDGEQWSRGPSAAPSPPPRGRHSMAYDAERQQVVVFGGQQGSGTDLADTWTWNGTSWTNVAAGNSPSARRYHAMAYDAKRKRVVLFGGGDNTTYHADTWEWNGVTWENVTPTESPGARAMSMMAYDAKRERIVLWGGADSASAFNDTWEWDGEQWTDVTPSDTPSPSARFLAAMAYDAARERVVLFGGASLINGLLNRQDTWTWDGMKWTEATPPAPLPPSRHGHAMIYDALNARVVLFGGINSVGVGNDLWRWDGATWTTIALASPPARTGHAMAYDEARGSPILFGGLEGGVSASAFDDTWLLLSRGGGCVADSDCGLSYCVDGVCCEVKRCGSCESCAGATPGICTAVTNAPDPDSCSGSLSCSGAGECKPSLGESCESGEGCASGHCVEGVCCDTSCSGGCESCLASRKESGESGVCGPVKAGSDSGGHCPDEGELSCRRNGLCDGTGGCQFYECASATCDGDHTLVGSEGMSVDCSPYKCSGTTCKTSCTSVLDCVYPNECSRVTRTCEPPMEIDGGASSCACHLPGGQGGSSSLAVGSVVALGWVGWSRRRRSSPRLP